MTETRARLFTAFQTLLRKHGRPPTVRELGLQVGLKSTRTVHDHLKALEEEGLLIRRPGARGLVPAKGASGAGLPVLGRVAAGAPLLAERNLDGELDVGSFFGPAEGLFVLKVQGDSMRDARIFDGDLVLVKVQPRAVPGEIVVAMVDDEVTIKRFQVDGKAVVLKPENEDFAPIAIGKEKRFRILGKVIGVFRKL